MFKKIYIFLIIIYLAVSCRENIKTIKIDKYEALEIAKKYKIDGDNVEIYFQSYNYP